MEELVQRLANNSNMQNVESVNSEERIFFVYKFADILGKIN